MTIPRTPSRPRLAALAALALLVVLVTACTGDEKPFTGADSTTTTVAPPPLDAGLVVLPPGFEPADTRGVLLTPLVSDEEELSEEDRSIPVTDELTGTATIKGRVTVDGRGAAARVRLERFVGDRYGVLDVDANGEGAFEVKDALGGRYRIRAWDAPEYSAIPSVTVFVPSKGDFTVDVPMRAFEGPRIQVALDTAVPAVGSPATLKALLTEQQVDGEGYLSGEGIGDGDLTLTVDSSSLRIGSANPTSTSADGSASWTVTCRSEGVHDVTVEYEETSVVVTLPACLPASEATTTSSSSTSSTSTTAPAGVAVGASFTPPYPGQLAAGRYEPADPAGCSVSYEVRSGETWTAIAAPVTGTLALSGPVRNVRPTAGTTACTYTRTA